VIGEESEKRTQPSSRGSGDSTHGKEECATRETCLCEAGAISLKQRPREGQRWLRHVADGSVVPLMPGNAGGGKGP